jgi:hypothetical protein
MAELASKVQAAMGLSYAISSLIGGWLAAKDIRYIHM